MGSEAAIALVFAFVVIWVGTTLVLLSRVHRMEGREGPQETRTGPMTGHPAH